MHSTDCIIIGASHSAAQLAPSLRRLGWTHNIHIIGNEKYLPYHRPPLSKDYLAGKRSIKELLIRPESLYENLNIQLSLNTHVESINPTEHSITLDNGKKLHYGKLVLATGSKVRKLSVPGSDLKGLYYIRSIADIEKIRDYVSPGRKAVIVGAGYIGLETAAMLTKLGLKVTVLESADRILERVTGNTVSRFLHNTHEKQGVTILTSVQIESFEGDQYITHVKLADGSRLPADLVIAGIGVTPSIELADAAGITINNGIQVDPNTQTSNPDIFAIGDCSCHFSSLYDRWVRLESVQNATDQANACAHFLCGQPRPYSSLPWFWSDQYDIKLQIAGLSKGYDQAVVRKSEVTDNALTVFYLKGDKILALDAINQPKDFLLGKRLIADQIAVTPEQLADHAFQLTSLY